MAFNVTNGASRLISGFLSDLIGRKPTLIAAFIVAGLAYLFMDRAESLLLWTLLAAAIGYAFGTLFAVSAPLVGECFGMDHFGAIIGVVFTAYGFVSGVIGPWLSGYLLDASGGDFALVFIYLGIFYLLAAVMIFLTQPKVECVLPAH
jgi:OFA family oxalate/formate antiporter-like MFS transporter